MTLPFFRKKKANVEPVEDDTPRHPGIEALGKATHPGKLTPELIRALCDASNLPRANFMAAIMTEGEAMSGFHLHSDGKWYPHARLELHKLNTFTGGEFADKYPHLFKKTFKISDSSAPQEEQYDRMREALSIVEGSHGSDPVFKAVGWGMGCVQGSNHKLVGVGTLARFMKKITSSEADQLQLSINYMINTEAAKYLRRGDFDSFALHYAGRANAKAHAAKMRRNLKIITGA